MPILKFHLFEHVATVGKLKGKKVFSVQPIVHSKVSFDDLCKLLSENTTVGKTDVKAVLSRLTEVIPQLLALGHTVDCGELGIFQLTYGSKPVENVKDFNVGLIRAPRVGLRIRKGFKDALAGATFDQGPSPKPSDKAKPKKPKPGGDSGLTPGGGGIGI